MNEFLKGVYSISALSGETIATLGNRIASVFQLQLYIYISLPLLPFPFSGRNDYRKYLQVRLDSNWKNKYFKSLMAEVYSSAYLILVLLESCFCYMLLEYKAELGRKNT